jgi:hypothetical protein
MKAFKRASQAAFERVYGGNAGRAGAIERLSIDVQLDGRNEIVSLLFRSGELSWSCTCAQSECAHARAALAFLSDAEPSALQEDRITELWDHAPTAALSADRRTVMHSDQAALADTGALAEILEDLLVAVVRAGVGAGSSAALDDALQRLVSAAPSPLPLGVSRWIGRLKRALGARNVDEAGRLLAGASLLIEDLRAGTQSAAARQRVLSWLGSLSHDTAGVARMTDRTLIEVAREQLPGLERAGLERRYLVDLSDGAVYREERAPSAPTASIGPCPRLLTVWLANVEQGAPPQRLRLLQYAVTPVIDAEAWQTLAGRAVRDFEPLLGRYREAQRAFPGLCEPFAVIAPARIEHDGQPTLVDDAGRMLHLAQPDNPAALRYLDSVTSGGAPSWVAGRLFDQSGMLFMAPLGAAVMRDGRLSYAQM